MSQSSIYYESKKDPCDPRWGDFLICQLSDVPVRGKGLFLVGFPSDLGVVENGGRPGAKNGPEQIRKFLFKLTSDPRCQGLNFIYDFGNLELEGLSLSKLDEKSRAFTTQVVTDLSSELRSRGIPICLGGGHEFAYSALRPFLESEQEDWIVVNVDAHLDARPYSGIPHSGTAFYRLVEDVPNFAMRLLEWGIQPSSCSRSHLDWLTQKGAEIVFADDPLDRVDYWLNSVANSRSSGKKLNCYLSVDIDAFSADIAPGCSAPQPLGIRWEKFHQFLKKLLSKTDLAWLGLFEVAPSLDGAGQVTSRLAAQIIHHAATEQLFQKQRQS